MKYISIVSLLTLFFLAGCMQSEDVDVEVIPDMPNLKSVSVGTMGNNGAFTKFENSLEEIDAVNHTAKVYVKTFSSMENIYAKVQIESGCTMTPISGATSFGTLGDFSQAGVYKITAASGASADWTITIEQDPNMPDISCLTDFWSGDGVNGFDTVFPSYSPSTVTAVKTDCSHVTLTFEFWASSSPAVVFELELGEPSSSDFTGSVTLLNDTSFSSFGYDCKYSAGPAGSYDLNTFTLTVDPTFEGYGTSYPFAFSKD